MYKHVEFLHNIKPPKKVHPCAQWNCTAWANFTSKLPLTFPGNVTHLWGSEGLTPWLGHIKQISRQYG